MAKHRIYTTSFASVYPLYVAKAEKKGRTKAEVDQVISWLTGYGQTELEAQLEQGTDFETFFAKAPKINPSRTLITGVVCGVRVEDVKEPTMREIRYLDKLIDELAKGKAMDRILPKCFLSPFVRRLGDVAGDIGRHPPSAARPLLINFVKRRWGENDAPSRDARKSGSWGCHARRACHRSPGFP